MSDFFFTPEEIDVSLYDRCHLIARKYARH